MNKLTVKMIVNVTLTVLSILLMLFRVTGVFAHEILGIVFIIVVGIHLFLNRNWFKAMAKKMPGNAKPKPKGKKSLLIWNSILILSTLLLIVSGIAISQVILPFESPEIFTVIHSLASKLFMLSAVAHVVLHRQYLKAVIRKFTGSQNKRE